MSRHSDQHPCAVDADYVCKWEDKGKKRKKRKEKQNQKEIKSESILKGVRASLL